MGSTAGDETPKGPGLAYAWLLDLIVQLPREQERFLTEHEVAQSSGMSRTPVREALRRLKAEGHVRRVRHKGAYVPTISDHEVRETMQARGLIEDWAVAEVARRPGVLPETLSRLIEHQAADETAEAFIAHDLEFHTVIIRAAGNTVLTNLYRSLRGLQMRMGVLLITADAQCREKVLDEHRAIVAALASGDPRVVALAVDAHRVSTLDSMLRRPMANGWHGAV